MSDHLGSLDQRSGDTFERHRPMLTGLAYRMVGSRAEAEDIVQETYVRWHGSARGNIVSPRRWLTTTLSRLAIDHLRSARVRRETYVGPWLPEPMVTGAASPERAAALAESLSTALLLVLETLGPVERAAYLLRVVFDTPYGELAAILGRSEAACRQLVSRAQRRVRARRPRSHLEDDERRDLLERLTAAVSGGEPRSVMALLTDDATLISDGGGKAQALPRPLEGARPIARFLVGVFERGRADTTRVEIARLNGALGLLVLTEGRVETAFTFETAGGRVSAIFAMRNPDKLSRLTTTEAVALD